MNICYNNILLINEIYYLKEQTRYYYFLTKEKNKK